MIVAIVGLGPRGLSVLERLLIRLRRGTHRVVIWVVDPVEHGPGRIWRTDQPGWLSMNATAGEVTVQSPDGHLDGEGFEAPHSLTVWTASGAYEDDAVAGVENPPRRVYGEYLRDVFERLREGAPAGVAVRPVLGEATGLRRVDGGLCLVVDDGRLELRVDKVVLATGHVPVEPTAEERALARHAHRHPGCRYVAGDSAADMPLEAIPAGATVAVRGLGLTFYDVVRSLTLGRGGRFDRDASGRLRYTPGGRQPRIIAGSRSGLPFLARPRIMGAAETSPRPRVLSDERIALLREHARDERGGPKLDFAREVEPLIREELQLAYDECAARLGRPSVPLDLDGLARPFAGETFASPGAFRERLLGVLRSDVEESRRGVRGSPLKAALEALRQLRPLLPAVVDLGGLLPASHRDFVERFEPMSYLLSAGPPDEHVEELVALIECGVVEIAGPEARFDADEAGCYSVESPPVAGSRRTAEVLVEARVPGPDLRRTASPLLAAMAAEGMVSEYVNVDPATGERFPTGGLAVTGPPFHVVDARGRPDPDVYAIGVATEGTRWFQQVGTGRPGKDSPFRRDADAIAADILAAAAAPEAVR